MWSSHASASVRRPKLLCHRQQRADQRRGEAIAMIGDMEASRDLSLSGSTIDYLLIRFLLREPSLERPTVWTAADHPRLSLA
jgi:hypothetical protein